ncbi:MAG: RIP metalloprotease RseP [Proteobacteria bacterium]|uniref:RIP metalloprotease RseP n=1 Tax=Aquabacterium sp. TaxID=1872578 RepID=UPI0035C7869B|nr:RIP metalloprotease RseP [Pseudomonadota bacterium]
MAMTLIAFLVTIGLLVLIHEYGHYRAAVACDVKVLRFSLGFGRVLWSRTQGETEFVVSALPLGGYVKMLDEREGLVDAREQHRAFNRKPLRQRAFIVAAGPLANLLLAVVLYACVNWAGVQEVRPWLAQPRADSMAVRAGLASRDEVLALRQMDAQDWTPVRSMTELQWLFTRAAVKAQDVQLQVAARATDSAASGPQRTLTLPLSSVPASEVDGGLLERLGFVGPYSEPLVAQLVPGGPADKGGLRTGDRVLFINGQAVQDAGQLRQAIRDSAIQGKPQPLLLRIERAGRVQELTLQPVMKDVQGKMLPRIDAGLGGAVAMVEVRYGLIEGFTRALDKTWEVSVLSLDMLGKMLVGQASIKNLSGPITIADYAGRSAQLGWVYYVGFLALVSVSLGVLNLLPLPVLDGGHLMYYLFESVTGRPVSDRWLERLQRGGVAIMLLMMSLALYNDLARLLGPQ